MFRGSSALVKFGRFVDIEEALALQDIPVHEHDVVTDVTPSIEIVVEEHAHVLNVEDADDNDDDDE